MLTRRAAALSMLVVGSTLGPDPVAAVPDARTGLVTGADTGYLGCVASMDTIDATYCFAAFRAGDGLTHVAAAYQRRDSPEQIVSAELPSASLTKSVVGGRAVVTLIADLPQIGVVHLTAAAELTVASSTSHACLGFPVQYSVTARGDDRSALGTFVSTSGTVAGTAVANWTYCVTTVLKAVDGYWALTHL